MPKKLNMYLILGRMFLGKRQYKQTERKRRKKQNIVSFQVLILFLEFPTNLPSITKAMDFVVFKNVLNLKA